MILESMLSNTYVDGYEWLIVLYLPFIFWRYSDGDSISDRWAAACNRVRDRLAQWKDRLVRCKLKGHDWEIERVQLGQGRFIGLGLCKRCKAQYWVKGEVGKLKGVSIIRSDET